MFIYQIIEIIQDIDKSRKYTLDQFGLLQRILIEKVASFRDLARMMTEASRLLRIQSRLISGYKFDNHARKSYGFHAWTALFISGAGRRGFDPNRKGLMIDTSDYSIHLTLI